MFPRLIFERSRPQLAVEVQLSQQPRSNSVGSSGSLTFSCDSKGALRLLKQSNFLDFSEILESRVEGDGRLQQKSGLETLPLFA
jgi:hypothetical protein